VVAWRGDEATLTRQPIVLGIDHDRDSQVAVKAAFEFADRLGLGIIAVHAWQNRRLAGDVAAPFVIDWNKVDDAARQHLSAALAPWLDLYPDVVVGRVVESDKPSRAMICRSVQEGD